MLRSTGTVVGTVKIADADTPCSATPGVAAEGRQRDPHSPAPAWPRLMSLRLGGLYLGLSEWTLREYVNDGSLPIVEARRPRTASALKHQPAGDTLRRLLVDRRDLDALADTFTKVRR